MRTHLFIGFPRVRQLGSALCPVPGLRPAKARATSCDDFSSVRRPQPGPQEHASFQQNQKHTTKASTGGTFQNVSPFFRVNWPQTLKSMHHSFSALTLDSAPAIDWEALAFLEAVQAEQPAEPPSRWPQGEGSASVPRRESIREGPAVVARPPAGQRGTGGSARPA